MLQSESTDTFTGSVRNHNGSAVSVNAQAIQNKWFSGPQNTACNTVFFMIPGKFTHNAYGLLLRQESRGFRHRKFCRDHPKQCAA